MATEHINEIIQRTPYGHALPWYVAPKYHAPGATVLNAHGEQVAEFEDIREARLTVARVNGRDQA